MVDEERRAMVAGLVLIVEMGFVGMETPAVLGKRYH